MKHACTANHIELRRKRLVVDRPKATAAVSGTAASQKASIDVGPMHKRTHRMPYVTQEKAKEAIEQLGRHIDRRMTTLDGKIEGLRADMVQGFQKVDERFQKVEVRLERVEEKIDRFDEKFQQIDNRFQQIDERFEKMDQRFERIETAQVNSDKLHNDNHLELKRMLGLILQEIKK